MNFAVNSSLLNSKCMLVLDELIAFLNSKPKVKIAIHGHTDNVGSDEKNLTLSDRRAKEVKDFLIDNGIDPKRLNHQQRLNQRTGPGHYLFHIFHSGQE